MYGRCTGSCDAAKCVLSADALRSAEVPGTARDSAQAIVKYPESVPARAATSSRTAARTPRLAAVLPF
eukprot:1416824-Pleurochrysis_carterae.AAC.4